MLQVKYRKNSMIKFDICGHTLLFYEVPYIDVPTLPENSKVKNAEIEEAMSKLEEGFEEKIKIEEKQCVIDDAHFDDMKKPVIEAVKETLIWLQKAGIKDERRDNLSGVILSRFTELSESYSWHIICSEIASVNTLHLEPITCH